MEKVKSEDILNHIMDFYAHLSSFKEKLHYDTEDIEKMKMSELDFDSLDVVELSLYIEEKYNIEISDEDEEEIYNMSCVDIANFINSKIFGE